jgi:hypothetical protein
MLAIWNILKLCIWYCLWPFGKFVVIWYIPPLVLVYCTKKNVATQCLTSSEALNDVGKITSVMAIPKVFVEEAEFFAVLLLTHA